MKTSHIVILILAVVIMVMVLMAGCEEKEAEFFDGRDDWIEISSLRYLGCCDCGLVHEIFWTEKDREIYIAFDRDQDRTKLERRDSDGPISLLINRINYLEYKALRDVEVFMGIMMASKLEVADSNRTDWDLAERLELAQKTINFLARQEDPNGYLPYGPNTTFTIEF